MENVRKVMVHMSDLTPQQSLRLRIKLLSLTNHVRKSGDDLVIETNNPVRLGEIFGELGITSYSELGPNSSLD